MTVDVKIGGTNESATITVHGSSDELREFVPDMVAFANSWVAAKKTRPRTVTEVMVGGCECAD